MIERRRIVDVYVDETELRVQGRPCVLYAAVIPKDLDRAIEGLVGLKIHHGLDGNFEVKWSSPLPDAKLKARLKEDALSILADHFSGLLNLSMTADKDEAFLNFLTHVESYTRSGSHHFVNLYYDRDCFRDLPRIRSVLESWRDPYCTTLAALESRLSVPAQFADLLAGTFRYMLLRALGAVQPVVVRMEIGDSGTPEELPLDSLFHILLRYTIPGVTPELDPNAEAFTPEHAMKECFGVGIQVNGEFTDAELQAIRQASVFYVGCMH
ncbi:MAG TPA: hypothetical protein VJO34_02870 [Methylomirabilota bacterium]|nr:hypothetical protein [Methylomirabilota bacterium]